MVEVTKKERKPSTGPSEVRRRAFVHPVRFQYAIARHTEGSLRLLHIPLGFDEEALLVFSSWETAQRYFLQRYFLSEVLSGEWYVRECSAGELVSLLLGPYEDIEWVLLDATDQESLTARGAQTKLMSRERFVEVYLLG
jgi:hypothetical protein